MAMLEFNGVAVKDPSSLTWSIADESSEESGRSTNDGKMNKDVITQKRKLELSWSNLTANEASTILKAVNYTNVGAIFPVRYPDTMSNTYETRRFYVGDRTAPMKSWTDLYNGKVYSTLSFGLIEE
jgi:hypothetical protein